MAAPSVRRRQRDEDNEREILPYPLNWSRGYGNTSEKQPVRWRHKSQEPFANFAGERTPIKAYRLYALSSLVKVLENTIHATIESSETYTNY